MKYLIYLSLFLVIIISCSKDDYENSTDLNCSVENPIEDLNWLKSEIDLLKTQQEVYNYVTQSKYKGRTIFIIANCNPLINSVFYVMDCDGNNIGTIGDAEGFIPSKTLDEGTIIWISEDSECILN